MAPPSWSDDQLPTLRLARPQKISTPRATIRCGSAGDARNRLGTIMGHTSLHSASTLGSEFGGLRVLVANEDASRLAELADITVAIGQVVVAREVHVDAVADR